MNKAIFLDRDGVLIHNRRDYVLSLDQMIPYRFMSKALALLSRSTYRILILTNQSAIGRGMTTRKAVDDINTSLLNIISSQGGRIDKVYICPHTPAENCACRKPQPGMILQAKNDFDLDLVNSWLVGDAFSDLQAGVHGGVGNLVLLQTGRGNQQKQKFHIDFAQINYLQFKNIFDFAKFIQKE